MLRASVRGAIRLLFGRNPIDRLFHEVRSVSHKMNSLQSDMHGFSLRLNATEQNLRRAEAAVRVLSEGMAALGSVAHHEDLDLLSEAVARGMRAQGLRFETLQMELDRAHQAVRRTRDAVGLDGDGNQSLLKDSGTVLRSIEHIKGLIDTVDSAHQQRSQVIDTKLAAVQSSLGHWDDDTPPPFESVNTLVDAMLQLQERLESVARDLRSGLEAADHNLASAVEPLLKGTNESSASLETIQETLGDLEAQLFTLSKIQNDAAASTSLLRSHLENHHVAGYCPDQWLSNAKGIHDGERCYLLGCGPSLSALDPELLRGHTIMGVNGTAKHKGLRLDYFMTVADVWWRQNQEILDSDLCEIRRFLPPFVQQDDARWQTSRIRVTTSYEAKAAGKATPMAFSHEVPRLVHLGGTVIFPALQVLLHLGFSEVILLGVDHDYALDMNRDTNGFVSSANLNHFDPAYYDQPTPIHCDLLGMERAYALADEAFRQAGRTILNATPGSRLDVFQRVDLLDVCACPVGAKAGPAPCQHEGRTT